LSEGASGRYDSALVTLDDETRAVVRIPAASGAEADLQKEVRALSALSAGVRAVLPFAAPIVLGHAAVADATAVVQTWLPGYRVDAAHVPPGPGVAPAIGHALAAVHALPVSVVRDAGLPVLDATQVRAEAERLLDRAEATGALPFGLLRRWSTAIATDALWRFETTVTLGGLDPASLLFEDDADAVPRITGLLHWGGLGVGDPAADLRWLASAPEARVDVLDAYADASHRTSDVGMWDRARLHAELEFASWLVHGHAAGAESIVADAVALLEALDENVRDAPALAQESITVDDAIAVMGRVPDTSPVDTSMQTDAYDAEAVAAFLADDESDGAASMSQADVETAPIEMSDWALATADRDRPVSPPVERADPSDDDSADADPQESARNALRRWTGTA
jgi:aminoglycoside phosphotransferase (APT) family kinase protein